MEKKFLLWVSITTLITFFILGCAKNQEGTGADFTSPAREEETRNRREERKTVGERKKLPQPWRISPAGLGFYSFPAWSPDGEKKAYTAYQDGRQDIWVVEVDEDGRPKDTPVNITNSASMDEHPSWSPDGKRIVFHSDREEGKRKLFVMDADGGNPELLYQHQTREGLRESFHPSWSPQGNKIAFVAENNIWVLALEREEDPRRITPFGSNNYPSWSPDGDWIVFSLGGTIYLIKADGSEEKKRLTGRDGMRNDFPGWSGFPSWSPDGEKIAFVSNKEKAREREKVRYNDLWIVRADGTGEARYLTNDRYRESFPAWSPQGNKLAFQSNRKDGFHIWAISLP